MIFILESVLERIDVMVGMKCGCLQVLDDGEEYRKIIEKRISNIEEEKKNNKWYKKTIDFIVEHKVPFIIGGVTLVVVAGGATYIIIKKRRRSIIWKWKDWEIY